MDTRFKQLERLRFAALAEGITLLLLLGIAVPLKHLGGQVVLVTVMGPVHGLAFLFYLWTISNTVADENWLRFEILQLVGCAMLPFGAWFSIRLIRRKAAVMARPRE